MRRIWEIAVSLILIFVVLLSTVSCDIFYENGRWEDGAEGSFYIKQGADVSIRVGESMALELVPEDVNKEDVIWTSSSKCVSVENGVITALEEGVAIVKAALRDEYDRIIVNVLPNDSDSEDNDSSDENQGEDSGGDDDYVFGSEYPCISVEEALTLAEQYTTDPSTESYYIVATVDRIVDPYDGEMYISDETGSIYVYRSSNIDGARLSATDITVGDILLVSGTLRNFKGTLEVQTGVLIDYYTPGEDTPTRPETGNNNGGENDTDTDNESNSGETTVIPGVGDPITSDPYVGVNVDEFYENYTPAISYMDAYYRTKHNLMSGSIDSQSQEPTVSPYRPKVGNSYIRNNVYLFSDDGNTYYVADCYGEVYLEIYRGGAYVVLEEVAAYVFAFGEPPANQSYSKNTDPYDSPWGEYLRVNNTMFSGDTSRYPYEPVLPGISGCGGDLTYYEMDIGTTGTDCDPDYPCEIYNNGYSITRGAARIVYSCKDENGNNIIDLDERYVFYTYNHYNDFQEYLNYYGGWGEMFGNITGGGTISSKYDFNPTDYVNVVRAPLKSDAVVIIYALLPKRELM